MKNKLFITILMVLMIFPLIASASIDQRESMITQNVKLLVVNSPSEEEAAGPEQPDAGTADAKAEDYFKLGFLCENDGYYIQAAKAYKKAISIKPRYKEAHYQLGLTYLMMEDKKYALYEYKILKYIDPDMAADLYAEIMQKDSADEDIRFAEKAAADNAADKEVKSIEQLNPDSPAKEITQKAPLEKDDRFIVQVGAYKVSNNADDMLNKLKPDYPNAYIEEGNDYNLVRIRGVKSKEDGAQIMQDISRKYNIKPYLRNAH